MKKRSIVYLCLLCVCPVFSQTPKEIGCHTISEERAQAIDYYLSSDWFKGREPGTEGGEMAAGYIASMFRFMGLQPAGTDSSYFQTISLKECTPSEQQQFSVHISNITYQFAYKADFDVATIDRSVIFEHAPLVFVGHGIRQDKWNDFKSVKVDGKIIVRLYGYQGMNDTADKGYKKFHKISVKSLTSKKNKEAMKEGVKAIIEIVPDEVLSEKWAVNKDFRQGLPHYEIPTAISGYIKKTLVGEDTKKHIPVFRVNRTIGKLLLRNSGVDIDTFSSLSQKTALQYIKPIKKTAVSLTASVKTKLMTGKNVLGIIQGESEDEYVIVGAHYDHLGTHEGFIWNGADDNGSGVTAMMMIANAFMTTGIKPKKTLIFAAWTAEESGLLGSYYFAKKAQKNGMNIKLYHNFDMIGRNDDDNCSLIYSLEEIRSIVEKNNTDDIHANIRYAYNKQPLGSSDQSSFALFNYPVMWLFTWGHPDYHQATDTPEKIVYQKLTRLTQLSFKNIWDMVKDDEF